MNFCGTLLKKKYRMSYSQCGEDLIVHFVLDALGIPNPSYLDIGAHDPVYLSNTYFFYEKGCGGVCVEPDPVHHEKVRKKRRRDICLNVGVGPVSEGKVPFYIMSSPTLNTFSKEEAERYQSYGKQRIEKVIDIPLVSINEILREYCPSCPDFVSLDVEGTDLAILSAFDFTRYRPRVFCIETLTYTEDRSERKKRDILEFMDGKGYMNYADTYINTVFVDRESWKNRS